MDSRIDEGVLQWYGHVERMENDRITKWEYVEDCTGSHSVGQPQKRWINAMKDCLKNIGLNVRQPGRIVNGGNLLWGM